MTNVKKRNGNIELMRFVFCIIIILYHINNRLSIHLPYPFSFFANGRVGVEFFFIVSGYLMNASAKKQLSTKSKVKSSIKFVFEKLIGIFPYHMVAFIITLICYYSLVSFKSIPKAIEKLISFLPSFFLIQKSGIYTTELLTAEWYLAAMLLMMLIMFPLILIYKDCFTKIICPIIAVILIGYMSHETGKLGSMDTFLYNGVISKAYIRAFADMAIGVFAYELVAYIKRLRLEKNDKIILTLAEFICYLMPILLAITKSNGKYESYAFYSIAIGIIITFSEKSYFNGLFDNRVIYKLGKTSLPLYLGQGVGLIFIKYSLKGYRTLTKIEIAITIIIITAIFTNIIGEKIKKSIIKKCAKMKPQ